MRMSHLIADSPEELREAADALGLKREYIQYPGTWKEHLDVSQSRRDRPSGSWGPWRSPPGNSP